MNTSTTRTDSALLRRYVEQNSQEAFAALVSRHLNMVYTTCLRELGSPSLAEDASQAVFILLAGKARRIRARVHLTAWLFQTARFVAKNIRTREARRKRYEQGAAVRNAGKRDDGSESPWSEIEPLLSDAVARLSSADRAVILLRYFDDLRLAEVGAAIGVSEEAARKRVTRALERLRRLLKRQGATLGAGALASILPLHAAKAAPPALAPTIARFAANAASGHVNAGLVPPAVYELSKGLFRTMKIAQWKIAGVVAATTVAVGAAALSIAHGKARQSVDLNTPIIGQVNPQFSPGAPADAYRNVLLTGRLVYENGKPAGGVVVAAQAQIKSMDASQAHDPQVQIPGTRSYRIITSKAEQEQSWNNTVTHADGTYSLPVGNDVSYNVMVFDNTGKWVAPALEGVNGQKDATLKASDLVLTKGAVIEGTITTFAGLPLPGSLGGGVMTYNPSRPQSSAAVDSVKADALGHYRIRVAPGVCRIYCGLSNRGSDDKTVTVAPGEVKVVNLQSP